MQVRVADAAMRHLQQHLLANRLWRRERKLLQVGAIGDHGPGSHDDLPRCCWRDVTPGARDRQPIRRLQRPWRLVDEDAFRQQERPMRQYRIAAIPADGIGPEVIAAGLEALDAVAARDGGFNLVVDEYDWGSARYRARGALMPADGLDQLRSADAIYFGAVGAPDIPDHITLWGLRLPICQGFDQYANVRPTRILPGVTSPLRNAGPGDLDWLIVRGEQRRRICRTWRPCPSRPAGGGRHRGRHLHPRRRRADHALRLRPGPRPAAQAADGGDQIQRPAPRHGVLGRDRRPGRRRLPGT